MPTSAVKLVFGPHQPRKTAGSVQTPARFSGNGFAWLGVRKRLFVAGVLVGLATASSASAQTAKVRIGVTSLAPARVRIEVELPRATDVLSFRNSYAGVLGLGERIETLQATNVTGRSVPVRKLAPGEFQAGETFSRFSYDVNVAEPSRPAQMSHVSWLNRDHGVLMLADLLPQSAGESGVFSSAVVNVEVPKGWTVASNLKQQGSRFSTNDRETAVFLLGSAIHERRQRIASTSVSIITSGKWPFSDDDALKAAGKIIKEYSRVTRFELKNDAVLMLVPYPGDTGPASWSAETRGNDVVLLLGQKASRKKVLAKLGIVLSHELFHLWVPNSLKLAGHYDWFFEGFTLYQALRTDLRLGLISFDEYLATIANVYDSYQSSADGDRLSLIEASERRWTTSSSMVYEKGMLVALVYDLVLRSLTECRATLDDVYADLFRLSMTGQDSANETIIRLLNGRDGLQSFAKDYIESASTIRLDATLATYGIKLDAAEAGRTKFLVGRDLSQSQRTLLGCIGYRK